MNLERREKFKQIKQIDRLGRTLKGDELLITLSNGKQIRTFGDIECLTVDRFGDEQPIKASLLTTELAIKIEQFSNQL